MRPVPQAISANYRIPGSHWRIGHHTGIDFASPIGTPVKSATLGTVYRIGDDPASYGRYVVVKLEYAGRTFYAWYCHLSAISVSEGDTVRTGRVLGLSGVSGNVTGPHLHFEVRSASNGYGDDVDPLIFMRVREWERPKQWHNAFYHGKSYVVTNSYAGLRKGRAKGFVSIDNDFYTTADGVWACLHWGSGRDFPLRRKWTGGHVTKASWAQVSKARSRTGKRIRTAAQMLTRAEKLGYELVEIDVKNIPTQAEFARLKGRAEQVGIKIVIKRLSNLPGAAKCLANAHAVGLTTVLLPRSGKPLSKNEYWGVTDYVRGSVEWE